jgi:hypothetical protein
VWALTIAGSATGVNALVNTTRRGRLDVLACWSSPRSPCRSSWWSLPPIPRLILVRPAVYLAISGLVNLVSCFADRPLFYTASTPMATKGDPERAVAYERAWHRSPELRRIHRQLTAGIGVVLVAYAVIRVLIVYSFPTGTAVLAQEVPALLLIALVVVVLIRLRVPRLRRIADAEQAALAAEPLTTNTDAGTARGGGLGVNRGQCLQIAGSRVSRAPAEPVRDQHHGREQQRRPGREDHEWVGVLVGREVDGLAQRRHCGP